MVRELESWVVDGIPGCMKAQGKEGWGTFRIRRRSMSQRGDGRREHPRWRSERAERGEVKKVFFLQKTLRGKISMVFGDGKADTVSSTW